MATLALAGAGRAQTADSAAAPPVAPTEITVYAKIIRDAPHLVKRFGRPMTFDRLARWHDPICVKVEGLSPEHDLWIAARMADIADSIGAPTEKGACDPNVVVIVAQPDLELRRRIGNDAYRYLNQTNKPVDQAQLAAFVRADGAPAHRFVAVGVAPANTGAHPKPGTAFGPPITVGPGSRLTPITEPAVYRAILVLGGQWLKGRSLEQIAAYAALLTLAEVRIDPPMDDPASITALFTDAAPGGLTVWDTAYLRALYGSDSQINLSMQQSVMADQLKRVVEERAGAPH